MTLDSATCYRALRARDARFDGRFFVAVSSTRIYCRPVCTVKPPRRENCRFYPSAAAAESGGLPALPALPAGARAGQRQRRRDHARRAGRREPDRGPDAGRRTGSTPSPRASASPTGTCAARSAPSSASRRWSSRRRSACCSPSACSPIPRCRSPRSRSRAASAACGASMRSSGSATVCSPASCAGTCAAQRAAASDALNFELSFRPPYDWPAVSAFLGARAVAGVEALEEGAYRRTVRHRAGRQGAARLDRSRRCRRRRPRCA